MRLSTPVTCQPLPVQIDLADTVLAMGSCFTEHIAGNMQAFRFPVHLNPTGVIYNPLSIAACLNRLVEGRHYVKSDLLQVDGLWCSLDHHGAFSNPDREETLARINQSFQAGKAALEKAKWIFLTFGTAFVYHHKDTGKPVTNCHRLP